jgi:hypothetical protein
MNVYQAALHRLRTLTAVVVQSIAFRVRGELGMTVPLVVEKMERDLDNEPLLPNRILVVQRVGLKMILKFAAEKTVSIAFRVRGEIGMTVPLVVEKMERDLGAELLLHNRILVVHHVDLKMILKVAAEKTVSIAFRVRGEIGMTVPLVVEKMERDLGTEPLLHNRILVAQHVDPKMILKNAVEKHVWTAS